MRVATQALVDWVGSTGADKNKRGIGLWAETEFGQLLNEGMSPKKSCFYSAVKLYTT